MTEKHDQILAWSLAPHGGQLVRGATVVSQTGHITLLLPLVTPLCFSGFVVICVCQEWLNCVCANVHTCVCMCLCVREREPCKSFVAYICCFCAVAPLYFWNFLLLLEIPTFHHQSTGFGHSLISLAPLSNNLNLIIFCCKRCTEISDFTCKTKPRVT